MSRGGEPAVSAGCMKMVVSRGVDLYVRRVTYRAVEAEADAELDVEVGAESEEHMGESEIGIDMVY